MVVVVEDGPRIRVVFVQTPTHVTLLRKMFNEAPTLTIVFRHGSYHLPLHLSTETKWHFLAQSEIMPFLRLGLLYHPSDF